MFGWTTFTCTLPVLIACVFAPQILTLWLRDTIVVNIGTVPLRLLLLAVALNSLYGCVYQLFIAAGKSRLVLQLNLASLFMASVVIVLYCDSGGMC